MFKVQVQKNLIALEDLLTGVGTVNQTRGKSVVEVTKINAMNLPFDETKSLQERIDEMDDQYDLMVSNRDLLMGALQVLALLQSLQVNIDELALWLVNGDNSLSAFHAYPKQVTADEVLADNLNYTMLEETEILEDVTITLGANTHLYIIKGEEFIP